MSTVIKTLDALLEKYSPDQERDDSGKWTDTGGGSGTESRSTSGQRRVVGFTESPWDFAHYHDAPDNRLDILSVAQAKEIRNQLDAQGRLNKDGRTVSLYHVTDEDTAQGILQHGLIPGASPAPGQPFKAQHSDYATYFHADRSVAERDIEQSVSGFVIIEARIPVTPKVLLRVLPDEDVSLSRKDGVKTLVEGGPVAFIGGVPPEALRILGILKYSEDQLRDDTGRWTPGPGSAIQAKDRVLIYHGTKSSVKESILQNGIQPRGGRAIWVTTRLSTAKLYAELAARPPRTQGIIVHALVPKTEWHKYEADLGDLRTKVFSTRHAIPKAWIKGVQTIVKQDVIEIYIPLIVAGEDELPALLEKYSPDQERDDAGRWTDGGGNVGGSGDSGQGSSGDRLPSIGSNASWSDRYPSVSADPSPGGKYEYHNTPLSHLESISNEGLKASAATIISTAPHMEAAHWYGEIIDKPSDPAVLIRMSRKEVEVRYPNDDGSLSSTPTPEYDKEGTREHAVVRDVAPEKLSVYYQGIWHSLAGIKKYDPDQARDDSGRWTSEGAVEFTEHPHVMEWAASHKVDAILYHGTYDSVMKTIANEGILPGGGTNGIRIYTKERYTHGERGHAVFAVKDALKAEFYAATVSRDLAHEQKKDISGIILAIRIPASEISSFSKDDKLAGSYYRAGGIPKEWIVASAKTTVSNWIDKVPLRFKAIKKIADADTRLYAILFYDDDNEEEIAAGARATLLEKLLVAKGGPGSGNFGHEGRPGEIGGSGPGGGIHEVNLASLHAGDYVRPVPIRTNDINKAAALIAQGKVVELRNPKQVNALLARMARIAEEAKALGAVAPNYNLCNVMVAGTNFFCHDQIKTKEFPNGIPRLSMPQLGGPPMEGTPAWNLPRNPWDKTEVDGSHHFLGYLQGAGIEAHSEVVSAASLKASQGELIGSKVGAMMLDKGFNPATNPIFISRDGYVVDGHHRWAAVVGRDAESGSVGKLMMNAVRVDAPIIELLHIANDWSTKFGIKQVAAKRVLCPTCGVEASARAFINVEKGGQGSGNFGHEGRPGEVGGSSAGSTDTPVIDMNGVTTNPLAHPAVFLGMGDSILDQRQVENYLEKYGQEFKASPRPTGVPKGKDKECFKNASLLVMERKDLSYAEGVGYTTIGGSTLGFLHAWAVTADGTVVDPTWRNPEASKYFGVKYNRAEYLQNIYKAKMYGVIAGETRTGIKAMKSGGRL